MNTKKIIRVSLAGLLLLFSHVMANEPLYQTQKEQNISVPISEKINDGWIAGIPQKTKSFFEGIIDDIKEFGIDNHIIDEKK